MRLIDADALKRIYNGNGTFTEAHFRTAIDEQPTVDAEPVRHGEWIRYTDHHWDSKFKCSRCEYETDVDTCFGKPLYNYCPYCGARMGGERKKDEQDGYPRTIRCIDCPLYLKSQYACMNCEYDIRLTCADGERKEE